VVTLRELIASGARSHRVSLTPSLREGEWNTLFEVEGPGLVSHLWFTFPPEDEMLGRNNLLRMFWDGEQDPSVEAPLSDFFGLPFGSTGKGCNFAGRYLTVAPKNGLNCYFPMPFARKARIEIFPEQMESGSGFYFQADYYRFPEELPREWRELRFHAQFRFENPCENYGRNYLFLDAVGEGALVGATFGIEANEPQLDSWYHGGGDSIFLDGETRPQVLHGIGAEDFFGHAWGVEEFQSPSIGTPMLEFEEVASPAGAEVEFGQEAGALGRRFKRVSLHRFFVDDPVVFHSSIRGVLGAMGNSYSSVAYWYQEEPHQRFFRTPAAEARRPGVVARYGRHEVEAEEAVEWRLLAPFALEADNPFEKPREFELKETGEEEFVYVGEGKPTRPGGEQLAVRWTPQRAHHNFVDFHPVGRPALNYIRLQTGVVGYALRYVECDREQEVVVHLGFDDEAAVRVNDREVFRGEHREGFREAQFKAQLKRGSNRLLVKLSNQANTTWRLWAFSFRMEPAG